MRGSLFTFFISLVYQSQKCATVSWHIPTNPMRNSASTSVLCAAPSGLILWRNIVQASWQVCQGYMLMLSSHRESPLVAEHSLS